MRKKVGPISGERAAEVESHRGNCGEMVGNRGSEIRGEESEASAD